MPQLAKWNLKCQEWIAFYWVSSQRGPTEYFKYTDYYCGYWLLSTTWWMIRPYCWGPHLCRLTGRSWTSAYLDASFLITSIHGARRYSACYWRRKVIINTTQIQTLRLITVTCLQATLVYQWHTCYGSNHFCFYGFKAHFMRWKPYLILLKGSRNWDLIGHWPMVKPNTVIQLQEHSNKLTPNDILLYL